MYWTYPAESRWLQSVIVKQHHTKQVQTLFLSKSVWAAVNMSVACAIALEQVENSVRCAQHVSRHERKGVENSGESCIVVWFRDSGTEEKTGGRAGGGKDGKCWASLWEWPGWIGSGAMKLKGQCRCGDKVIEARLRLFGRGKRTEGRSQ